MRTLLAVAAGGVLGGSARYGVTLAAPAWSTFLVNTAGAYLLALLVVVALEAWPGRSLVRPLVGTGFLGSFTTFSTWMVELDSLAGAAGPWPAALHLLGGLAAGLAAAVLGLLTGRWFTRRRDPRTTS